MVEPDTSSLSQSALRIVATADNHLNRYYDRMTPQKLSKRRKYLQQGFKAAVDYAIDWSAHLFLIAGDLFDQTDPRNLDRWFVARCLAELKRVGVLVFAIGGNHDTPRQSTEQGGIMPLEIYHYLDGLYCFGDPTQIQSEILEIEGMTVVVGGLNPDPTMPAGSDPLEGLTWGHQPLEADFGILLLHGLVEGYATLDSPDPVIKQSSLANLDGVNLFVIGDSHKPAYFKAGERHVIVPGATERMTFGEDPGVPGFATVEIGRNNGSQELLVNYKRVQLAGQPRAELTVRATELDPSNPTADLISRLEPFCAPDTLVKLRLEGFISLERYHALEVRQLYEAINPKTFHFTLDNSGLLIERPGFGQFLFDNQGVTKTQPEVLEEIARELMVANLDPGDQDLTKEALQKVLEYY